jgi:hypothetical protein
LLTVLDGLTYFSINICVFALILLCSDNYLLARKGCREYEDNSDLNTENEEPMKDSRHSR